LNDLPRTLPDLVGSSQEADLKAAEEEYLRDKAAREELFAKSRKPGEVNLSQLMKQMYGDDSTQPAPSARQPPTAKEDANVKQRSVEAFPPPPTGRR
jgi:hypothetical protein